MADLGNLYFDILFRDKTAEQRKKLKAEITKDLQAKLDVGFDKKKLVGDMKTLLQSEKFKINVVVDKASTTQAVRAALQAAGLNTNFTASDLRAAKAAAIQTKAEASAAAARELARQRAARAAKAELDLANARERSANAARRHMTATLNMNGAMNSQLSIVGQLRNEFLGLYSIYAAQNFLRAVVDIGGELENQKIAMASILQDEGKATTIFNQIKKLAVTSPFGVMDLNQYAKQLSAYSIPYNELYDTMKRLADISAGVGVDMGRIILAFGQIKAAKFLKGTELRQLTEANIPMVDKLAERFSKLEGRIVSAGEVLDMVSKKKVTFECSSFTMTQRRCTVHFRRWARCCARGTRVAPCTWARRMYITRRVTAFCSRMPPPICLRCTRPRFLSCRRRPLPRRACTVRTPPRWSGICPTRTAGPCWRGAGKRHSRRRRRRSIMRCWCAGPGRFCADSERIESPAASRRPTRKAVRRIPGGRLFQSGCGGEWLNPYNRRNRGGCIAF